MLCQIVHFSLRQPYVTTGYMLPAIVLSNECGPSQAHMVTDTLGHERVHISSLPCMYDYYYMCMCDGVISIPSVVLFLNWPFDMKWRHRAASTPLWLFIPTPVVGEP